MNYLILPENSITPLCFPKCGEQCTLYCEKDCALECVDFCAARCVRLCGVEGSCGLGGRSPINIFGPI